MIEAKDVAAILLAAGRSDRFGERDKLLAPLGGIPLALHAARRITEFSPGRRIAVCRDSGNALAKELAAMGFDIAVNRDADLGLSRSLAIGIEHAAALPVDAALICLGDMPFVRTAHLRTLLTRLDPASTPVVASSRGGALMPPALFARALFDRLLQGHGDTGARSLLATAALVEADAAELADIDRPGDLSAV